MPQAGDGVAVGKSPMVHQKHMGSTCTRCPYFFALAESKQILSEKDINKTETKNHPIAERHRVNRFIMFLLIKLSNNIFFLKLIILSFTYSKEILIDFLVILPKCGSGGPHAWLCVH